jgi:hypothetical protein
MDSFQQYKFIYRNVNKYILQVYFFPSLRITEALTHGVASVCAILLTAYFTCLLGTINTIWRQAQSYKIFDSILQHLQHIRG